MAGLLLFLSVINLLAQSAASIVDVDTLLKALNVGVAGVWLVAFVKGWIVPGKVYAEALKREQDNVDELNNLRELIQTKVIPEMILARQAHERTIELTRDLMRYHQERAAQREPDQQ